MSNIKTVTEGLFLEGFDELFDSYTDAQLETFRQKYLGVNGKFRKMPRENMNIDALVRLSLLHGALSFLFVKKVEAIQSTRREIAECN